MHSSGIVLVDNVEIVFRLARKARTVYRRSVRIIVETVPHYKTVWILRKQVYMVQILHNEMVSARRVAVAAIAIISICYGVVNSVLILLYTIGFYYGSELMQEGSYSMEQVLIIIFIVMFTLTSGVTFTLINDRYDFANKSVSSLLNLFNPPEKSYPDDKASPPTWSDSGGRVQFTGVDFSYPARPNISVLRNMNFRVPSARSIAIVGDSRSGKTAMMDLLLRIYEANNGSVDIENASVVRWNVDLLRSGIGYADTSLQLFGSTIADAIQFGAKDKVSMATIYEVLRVVGLFDWVGSIQLGVDAKLDDLVSHFR